MNKYFYLIMIDKIQGGITPVIKGGLWILSFVYGFALIVRKILYRMGILKSLRLSQPVISVGNITVGGAGKTPLVGYIARALKNKGLRPAVLMRGYMPKNDSIQPEDSDEAAMLKLQIDVPILVGPDRVKNANAFVKKEEASVFLLDDGFQHWRLARDLDIVAVDATNPWGNGHLLPRGILREPKGSLSRAQIIILTKTDFAKVKLTDLTAELKTINPNAVIVESIHKPISFYDLKSNLQHDLFDFREQKVCAVCSIGSPESFIKTLEKLGLEIKKSLKFLDHHIYDQSDVEQMVRLCQNQGMTTIVTTEKDAVKINTFMNLFPDQIRILVLKVEIFITNGEDIFFERITHIL